MGKLGKVGKAKLGKMFFKLGKQLGNVPHFWQKLGKQLGNKVGEATREQSREATGEVGKQTRETNFSFPTSTREDISKTGELENESGEKDSKTRENEFSQHLENLPTELLSQPRFFALLANDKSKPPTGWNLPANQKLASALHGVLGFDTSGHDIRTSYLFLDFDHVLHDGKFVADSVLQLLKSAVAALVCTLS